MGQGPKPKITVFHCINSLGEGDASLLAGGDGFESKFVKLPCSSMVKDVFLLRAFEAGADAVVVLVCPAGACRYVEGNLRAQKRVRWVQNLLDDIGLNGRRLSLFNLQPGDTAAAERIVQGVLALVADLGRNPVSRS
ncbi:MAG: hydrogenase iron-sulfur subunit [Deltaproteobacteria bacterium]|nr:hydrogenase iron-sulfur subunit [Deltaproteobacteria bacterium]